MAKKIDKSKMACNKPKRQVSGGKKFVVKACVGGKEKDYSIRRRKHDNQEIEPEKAQVVPQGTTARSRIKCRLVTGRVRSVSRYARSVGSVYDGDNAEQHSHTNAEC